MNTKMPIPFYETDLVRLVALQQDLWIEQDLEVTRVPTYHPPYQEGFVLVQAKTLLGALFLSLVVLDRKAASRESA